LACSAHPCASFFAVSSLLPNARGTNHQIFVAQLQHLTDTKSDTLELLLPLNLDNQHWVLACIIIRTQEVNLYDSLSSASQDISQGAPVYNLIRSFFDEFMPAYKLSQWTFQTKSCPQQEDETSCGLFVIVTALHLASGQGFPHTSYHALWRSVIRLLLADPEGETTPFWSPECHGHLLRAPPVRFKVWPELEAPPLSNEVQRLQDCMEGLVQQRIMSLDKCISELHNVHSQLGTLLHIVQSRCEADSRAWDDLPPWEQVQNAVKLLKKLGLASCCLRGMEIRSRMMWEESRRLAENDKHGQVLFNRLHDPVREAAEAARQMQKRMENEREALRQYRPVKRARIV